MNFAFTPVHVLAAGLTRKMLTLEQKLHYERGHMKPICCSCVCHSQQMYFKMYLACYTQRD